MMVLRPAAMLEVVSCAMGGGTARLQKKRACAGP